MDQTSPTTWEFELVQGVKSPYGNEFTSADITYLWNVYNPGRKGIGAFFKNVIAKITAVTAKDKYTVVFETDGPAPMFLQVMTTAWSRPFDTTELKTHQSTADPYGATWLNRNAAGYGPYQITSWNPGTTFTMERRTDYYGTAPYLDTVTWQQVPDPSNRLFLLLNGTVGAARSLQYQDLRKVTASSKLRVQSAPGNFGLYLLLDYNVKPWDDVRMRQAVAYAIPYAQIISKVYSGFATPLQSIEVPAYEGYTAKYWTYSTDMAKAKALVAQAGGSGATMTLSYTAANPQHEQVAIALQTVLAELGITVTLDQMPAAAFTAAAVQGDCRHSCMTPTRGSCPRRRTTCCCPRSTRPTTSSTTTTRRSSNWPSPCRATWTPPPASPARSRRRRSWTTTCPGSRCATRASTRRSAAAHRLQLGPPRRVPCRVPAAGQRLRHVPGVRVVPVEYLGALGPASAGSAASGGAAGGAAGHGLLEIRGLGIEVAATGAALVRGVDLTVAPGEVHGLVGETGAGKSLTAWSVLGLLPDGLRRAAGSITLGGTDLTACSEAELHAIRGRDVAMIVQNPRTALVPTMTIGHQLALVHRARSGSSRKASQAAAADALASVRLPDPVKRMRDYPHQLSGGQAQRVVIAMALLDRPRLVIADEATTGLDVTVQAEVLDLLLEQVAEVGAALLLITHDLGVVANYADVTTAMFAGEVVETGPTRALFEAPAHPYLRGLLAAAELDNGEADAAGPGTGTPAAPRRPARGQRVPPAWPRGPRGASSPTGAPGRPWPASRR